jgi:ubiquinone/menaquinone biosynthesis C-methylase UbiE
MAGEIVEMVGVTEGSRVLDAGCGTGILLPFLTTRLGEKGTVVALDISRRMLSALGDGVGPRVLSLQADAGRLPLADMVFDLVFCHNVFPHFGDKAATLRELARVLRPTGRLAITHGLGRKALDNLHRKAGGPVGGHVLDSNHDLRHWCAGAGLRVTRLEDTDTRFLLVAEKK